MIKKSITFSGMLLISLLFTQYIAAQSEAVLTVKEIMNAIITPTTTTIWGAYELQTEAEWQEIANAALAVIGAGELLSRGGADAEGGERAAQAQWQNYNGQMMAAARQVLLAVEARDEEALSAAGNDLLYPPCESCHQQYQNR